MSTIYMEFKPVWVEALHLQGEILQMDVRALPTFRFAYAAERIWKELDNGEVTYLRPNGSRLTCYTVDLEEFLWIKLKAFSRPPTSI